MRIEDATPGTRVYYAPGSNAAFWRGEVRDHGDVPVAEGLVMVKWDGVKAQTLIDVSVLELEQ
jgi:hypothetical protein